MNIRNFYQLIMILFISWQAQGSIPDFKAEASGNKIVLTIELQDNKIYWVHSGNNGLPTKIDLSESENLSSSNIIWTFPQQNKLPEGLEYYYRNKLVIPIYLEATNKALPIILRANINYLLCGNQCVPMSQKIEKLVYISDTMVPDFKKFSINEVSYHQGLLQFTAKFDEAISNVPNFIVNENNINFIQHITSEQKDRDSAVVKIYCDDTKYSQIEHYNFDVYSDVTDIPSTLTIKKSNNMSLSLNLLIMLATGFIGGFILNFMPCVLPVLSLKLLSFTKKSTNKRISLFLSLLGIISSFFFLGLTSIFLKASGEQFGFGTHFQNPKFIIFLTIILTIFISSTIDGINIDLPLKIRNILNNHKISNNYINDFFSGVLATILSTPCVAPFLGTAMAFALANDSHLVTMSVFIVAAIGFAMPYLLLIIYPRLTNYIPKPGKWMMLVKKMIAGLLVLTMLWLCNILYEQIGLRPTFGLILLLILLKFLLENKVGIFSSVIVKISSILLIILAALYLPKIAHNEDLQHTAKLNNIWQEFDQSSIDRAVKEGRIVVVDITAEWCTTCKFNKLLLWDRSKTIKLFKTRNILAMRAEYTNFNDQINQYLLDNNIYGIPFNKVYGPKIPEGVVLPTIVFYSDLLEAINLVDY